jgi:hypothetical protein
MELNPKKCGIVGPDGVMVLIINNNQVITQVPSYKYLGFPFDQNGINFSQHMINNHTKA